MISYCTSPRSTAIQWLPPAQTHGGKRPYLFTQGQAIHSRSLLPCQDCPSVKVRDKMQDTGDKPSVACRNTRLILSLSVHWSGWTRSPMTQRCHISGQTTAQAAAAL